MRLLHNDVMFVLLAINTVKPDVIFVLQGRFKSALKSSLFTLATKVAFKKSPMYVNGTRATKT